MYCMYGTVLKSRVSEKNKKIDTIFFEKTGLSLSQKLGCLWTRTIFQLECILRPGLLLQVFLLCIGLLSFTHELTLFHDQYFFKRTLQSEVANFLSQFD